MRRLRPLFVGLLLLAATLAGCAAAPAAPPDPFPPRPVAIDINRLDPCSTLSPSLAAEWDVGAGSAGSPTVDGIPTRACGWGSMDDGFNYTVQLIPQDARPAAGAPGARVGSVAGFGTVTQTERVDTYPFCEVIIDAADGAVIRVQVQSTDTRPDGRRYSAEEVCGRADRAAADVVGNARRVAG